MDEKYLNFFKLYSDDTNFSIIHKNFISLQDEDIKENNQHLRRILTEGLIPKMKRNDLFNEIYKKIKYAGSFYKGTKVGKPNEYDLDLIVQLPMNYMTVKLETEHEHCGYVQIKVDENDKLPVWERHRKILNTWIDEGYLNQNKFRQWMESVMTKAFEQLEKNGRDYYLTIDDETYVLKAFSKSGPAFTLNIRLKGDLENEMMSVDIVPSLEFNGRLLQNYKVIPDTIPTFVVIPKPLDKIIIQGHNLWRVSFYDQEKQILSEKEFTKIKPVIRLLKKFRDRQKMNLISSYFIETLCLHELICRKSDIRFFRGPMTGLFVFMLSRLFEVIYANYLPFFWHEKHNLLFNIDKKVMENNCNRIQNVLKTIEKRYLKHSLVIAEYILTEEELKNLKQIVSRLEGNLMEETKITSSSAHDSPNPSTSIPKPITEAEPSAGSSSVEIRNFDDSASPPTSIPKPMTEAEPSAGSSNAENTNCDAKEFPDEANSDPVKIIFSALEGTFPPEQIEALSNLCRDYSETKRKADRWLPVAHFMKEVIPSHTAVHRAIQRMEMVGEYERKKKDQKEN